MSGRVCRRVADAKTLPDRFHAGARRARGRMTRTATTKISRDKELGYHSSYLFRTLWKTHVRQSARRVRPNVCVKHQMVNFTYHAKAQYKDYNSSAYNPAFIVYSLQFECCAIQHTLYSTYYIKDIRGLRDEHYMDDTPRIPEIPTMPKTHTIYIYVCVIRAI